MAGFGSGYEPREYDNAVPEGDYEVKLGMPIDTVRGGYNMRDIPIQIRGKPGKQPSKWTIFDRPTDDLEKMEKWNKQRTRDADAFGVQRGDFRPTSWAGKVGYVHIGKNEKNGYMEVKWSVIKNTDAMPLPSKPVQVVTKQMPSGYDDVSETPPFDSDIPF